MRAGEPNIFIYSNHCLHNFIVADLDSMLGERFKCPRLSALGILKEVSDESVDLKLDSFCGFVQQKQKDEPKLTPRSEKGKKRKLA